MCTQKLMTSTYACSDEVCVCYFGVNAFQLPSNTVEGACSAYESECVCVFCGGVYEIIIIISQLHWVSLRAAH